MNVEKPEGQAPTTEEVELFAWADQAHKNGMEHLHTALDRMVTLITALLAGSAAFYVQLPASPAVKGTAALLLMLGLVAALVGWLPMLKRFDISDPEEIQKVRGQLQSYKIACLRVCCTCLWLAFATLLSGMILFAP